MEPATKTAMNKFYSAKAKYEKMIKEKKRTKQKNLKNASADVRKSMMSNIDKRSKCVECGQAGGNTFTVTKNILSAKCQADKPCGFDLEINRGVADNIFDVQKQYIKENHSLKTDIIHTKLKILFDFVSETEGMNNFEQLQTQYDDNNKVLFELKERIRRNGEVKYAGMAEDLKLPGEDTNKASEKEELSLEEISLNLNINSDNIGEKMSRKRYGERADKKIALLKAEMQNLLVEMTKPGTGDRKKKSLKSEYFKTYQTLMRLDTKKRRHKNGLVLVERCIDEGKDKDIHSYFMYSERKHRPDQVEIFLEKPTITGE